MADSSEGHRDKEEASFRCRSVEVKEYRFGQLSEDSFSEDDTYQVYGLSAFATEDDPDGVGIQFTVRVAPDRKRDGPAFVYIKTRGYFSVEEVEKDEEGARISRESLAGASNYLIGLTRGVLWSELRGTWMEDASLFDPVSPEFLVEGLQRSLGAETVAPDG